MKYEKIHACRNDCCLFRKELSDANVCPSCGMSRWKIPKNSKKEVKNVPVKVMWPSKEQLDQAHLYVIQNVNDVLPYVEQHMESLRKLNSGKARSKKWIQEEHNCSFSRWLSTRVALALEVPKNSITPSLRWIAHGPSPDVATYSCYMINGYYYHTKRRDDIKRVQNSGVSITATTMQVSSSKDKNSVISGVKVDELGFTIVDLKRIGHKSDSFILATQAKQVFYVKDFANPKWSMVLTSPQRTIEEDFFEDEIEDMLQECGYETIQRMPNVDTPKETDDTISTYIRHDCEGRWVEKVRNITAIFMIHRWRIIVRMKEKCFQNRIQRERRSKCVYNHHMSRKGYANLVDELDELVVTHKNEDILTAALGSKEHGGRVRRVGGFVSQSQYFNTVKGKEKMITPQVEICYKEENDSRCKSDKKRRNHSRSSIGRSINNIIAVATIVDDNIGCPNVKVLVDVVTGENLTIPNPVKGKIETLNQALGNAIEWPRRLVSTINDKQEHSTRKDVVYSSNYTDINGTSF
ncbi:transposase [Cucumis melo var. makuwa]|uniref:Transposase n=1 Tax=Cucumis melo var. makuwa TaxID=1194695 RepID=A0A5D3CBH5_CUCMM|nr:transposase [Cucumis melo var. makuwa]TYK09347.1 transposase [Cucumis melo var. makuwa]